VKPPFLLALNTSTIKPAPLLDKIKIAGEAGYDAVELWFEDLDAYVGQGGTLRDVRSALDDQGLVVPTAIHFPGAFDAADEAFPEVLERARRRFAQAAEVGAARVITGPPRFKPVDVERTAARYRKLLEIGREEGALPAFEFLGFVEGIHTVKGALEIVERAGDPDGAIVLDPFHIFRGGSRVDDIELVPVERIAVYHFNDATDEKPREEQQDKDRVLPGDGVLPLAFQLRYLVDNGYRGAVSLELFSEELWRKDPREVAAIGLEKMLALVETVTDED